MSVTNKRVAVIGCGPSGISALVAFDHVQKRGEAIPEIVCFEKQDEAGGLWNYSWHTGTDKYGENCHNSMYRYLWSNGPKEVLEMADYTFSEHVGKPIGSYPPRMVLKDYVLGRAKKHNIDRWIRYSTVVRHVEKKGEQFMLTSQNLKTKEGKQEIFDYIIVATGHFSVPSIAEYPGIDNFKGRVMHSHDFRDAAGFRGMKMLLVGNSYSAEDIALQCHKYGVEDITLAYRTKPTGFNWPKGVREVPGLVKFERGCFHFVDGSKDNFDVVMFCTGFQHNFPFLTEDLKVPMRNHLWIDGLYKGVMLNSNPNIMYIAMMDQYYTFTMFDAQACYARDYILGKTKLEPDMDKRAADIKMWGNRFAVLKDGHDDIDYQRDYVADLLEHCEYPEHNHAERAELLHRWKNDRHNNILTYRDQSFTSVMTGDVAPLPAVPWVQNLDDSIEGYYRNKARARVAVIGAGPSGISALVAFNQAEQKGESIPEVVCFEKQDGPGGLWNYSWHTGTDKYGEQCHNSMYRYLWSNGPKEVLEMGDYTFAEHYGRPIGSYPPRMVLKDYVLGRGRKNNIDRFCRYQTVVRHIEPQGEQFIVHSQNLKSKNSRKEVFDYIIVASGHFSVPQQPTYPGIDDFKGRVMHAHDFRDAVGFRGQKMLLIGNSYSAEDIALQCNKYGVEDISLSYRSSPTGFQWPKGIREIPQLMEYENGYFHFVDGSKEQFDVVMFCTGYQHHFPFMTDDIALQGAKNLCHVDGLYKSVVLNKNPRVMYLGMTDQYYTFTMFDAQACYARDLIMGKFEIEQDEKKRAEDIKLWADRFKKCKSGHDEIDYQRDLVADLFKYCEYPEHNHAKRAELLHRWKNDRHTNILTYRDQSYTSVMTGDVAPLPKTPWHKNMDDTIEGFINISME